MTTERLTVQLYVDDFEVVPATDGEYVRYADFVAARNAALEDAAKVGDECAASAAWTASDAGAMNNIKAANVAQAERRMAEEIAAAIRALKAGGG